MTDTLLVRPRRGLILAGIPLTGAELPRALAEEWIADQLVERIEPPPVVPTKPTPSVRRSPKGSGATRPRKQHRSSR